MRTYQATRLALASSPVLFATLSACGSPPAPADEGATASSEAALLAGPVGGLGDPDAPLKTCPPSRYDLYRLSAACATPPAAAGGTWKLEYLYPDAPSGVRERFCAYTWSPSGFEPSCAAVPHTIVTTAPEQLIARGNCPLTKPGCGVTHMTNGDSSPPDAGLGTGAATNEPVCSGGVCQISQPSTGPGCCEACAGVGGKHVYVVLPSSTSVSHVWFDVLVGTGELERVDIYQPTSRLVDLALDPAKTYSAGNVLWFEYQ